MGIDTHALKFLSIVRKEMSFGDTVTIGRQGLHVNEKIICQVTNSKKYNKTKNKYCEDLFEKHFGSKVVHSIDNSDYEGATHIHDMSLELPINLQNKYDTVIDAGCLEHIYDIPQALRNISLLCKPGAQIIHILPSNNFCGHGFWQISPELFFSLYSQDNGYNNTKVFVAGINNTNKWYSVKKPSNGERAVINSNGEMYVIVRTLFTGPFFSHKKVYQSDYVSEWSKMQDKTIYLNGKINKIKKFLKHNIIIFNISLWMFKIYKNLRSGLNVLNPSLKYINPNKVDATEMFKD
jgi:hypothetical protein